MVAGGFNPRHTRRAMTQGLNLMPLPLGEKELPSVAPQLKSQALPFKL